MVISTLTLGVWNIEPSQISRNLRNESSWNIGWFLINHTECIGIELPSLLPLRGSTPFSWIFWATAKPQFFRCLRFPTPDMEFSFSVRLTDSIGLSFSSCNFISSEMYDDNGHPYIFFKHVCGFKISRVYGHNVSPSTVNFIFPLKLYTLSFR